MSSALALAADPSVLDRAADPGEVILQGCGQVRAWLHAVRNHGDIGQIAECRSQVEAIRIYAMSRQLGKEVQLTATEIVRLAERRIGVAIRRGQEQGEIRRHGQGSKDRQLPGDTRKLPSPTDFATADELSANGAGIYHLTDGVPDELFEQALAEAKAEGNLSRANLVRKIRQQLPSARRQGGSKRGGLDKPANTAATSPERRPGLIAEFAAKGMSSGQIADRLAIGDDMVRAIARDHEIAIPADVVLGRTRRPDPARIVREIAEALEAHAMSAHLAEAIGLVGLDPAEAAGWAASMDSSLRVLRLFARQIREVTT